MLYIPKNLYRDPKNEAKVSQLLADFAVDVGEDVQQEKGAILQQILDLGEDLVHDEIIRQLG
jgi:hypothetical protein